MSTIIVFGSAVIIEGIVNSAMWLAEQMNAKYNVIIRRIERRRRFDKSRRWA